MLMVVLGFIAILLVTFGVVIAMTRQSPQEQTIAQRMESIHIPARKEDRDGVAADQLLKTTRRDRFGWLEQILQQFKFAQVLRVHIFQAHSLTNVATLILSSLGLFFAGYCIMWLFAPMILIDLGAAAALGLLPYRDSLGGSGGDESVRSTRCWRSALTCWPGPCVRVIPSPALWKCWLRIRRNRRHLNSEKFSSRSTSAYPCARHCCSFWIAFPLPICGCW